MSPVAAAALLAGPVAVLCYLNLYFLLLSREGWAGAARRVGVLATSCGVNTSTCAVVARTPWARVVFGVPNTVFGLLWCGALAWLAVGWIDVRRVVVPWWALAAAAATMGAAVLLIWALRFRLKQPCPL